MEENNNVIVKKNNTGLIVFLIIIILGLAGYICYDKFIKKTEEPKIEDKGEPQNKKIDLEEDSDEKEEETNSNNYYGKIEIPEENDSGSIDNIIINGNNYSIKAEKTNNKIKYIVNGTESLVDDEYILDATIYELDGNLVIVDYGVSVPGKMLLFDKDGNLIDIFDYYEENKKIDKEKGFIMNSVDDFVEFSEFNYSLYYTSEEDFQGNRVIKNMTDYCEKKDSTYEINFDIHCNEQGFYLKELYSKCS